MKGVKLNISWLNVLWTILNCSHMPLGWPTPEVCPSWSMALAKPAGHTLSSINIFQTWPRYTDSYQIFHCVWMKGCSSAVLLWLTLMKHQSVTKTKYWHTIFSQLFSFTLRHKLCLSEYSPSRPFLHALCVFDHLDASEAQSVLCLSILECAAQTHTHTHFSLGNSVSRADCTLNILLSNMSSNLVTVKTAFYNNRQTIDLILTLSFGQGGTKAPLWREGSCARRNAAIILRSQNKIKPH